MSNLSVFVASSTEGKEIARELRAKLQEELGDSARVQLWAHGFESGQAVIEELERFVRESDFAIVLLTPDDVTTQRSVEKSSPRDNLIFELGLFTAGLGRDRTSAWTETGVDMKLPSDLAGVTRILFDNSSSSARQTSFHAKCVDLASRMMKKGPRGRWLPDQQAAVLRNEEFARRIEGMWWDRVNGSEQNALGAFKIVWDPLTPEVKLRGSAYDLEGGVQALWQSDMARLDLEHQRLTYLWRGRHPSRADANVQFHGYGYMEFDMSAGTNDRCDHAGGLFWNVNEKDPSLTAALSVDRWRIVDESQSRTMQMGSDAEKREVVRRVLDKLR